MCNYFSKYILFLLLLISNNYYSQFIPKELLNQIKESDDYYSVSISKNIFTERFLKSKNIHLNNNTNNWYYLYIKGKDYFNLLNSEIARYIYTETSEPTTMNDTSRMTHFVNQVHQGIKLPNGFTGKNVVLGIIDSGVDFLHEDFKDKNGKTRVYRYWDQSNKTPISPVLPYNYGMVWTNSDIDNGLCTAKDDSGHGTNVAGVATGNGRANGKNKGMAPDATIVIVETNLSATNWTLTVADACEYIFKVADSLGLPAVINNSNGVQFGSHDGSDPASEKIEALLDAKPGRILVASAGNSGDQGKYHIHNNVDSDTSFYWVKPSINGIAGVNTIYVDMWSDSIDFANINFSTGANLSSGYFSNRGNSKFSNFNQIYSKAPNAFRDTLFSFTGNKLAFVDYYASIVNHVARIEWVITSIDSTNYYYQFKTTGKGSFDGWSGEKNKKSNGKTYTDFVTESLPSPSVFPEIKNYVLADSLQTIFSSYISSEKVITVGNISNRNSFKAKDGNTYSSSTTSGKIFPTSSKGPNRKNVIKPDIVASGNFTITSAPLYVLNNSLFNSKIDIDGMHFVNGGTSMSSPVIAGIAALYLEKCSSSTYEDFKNELSKSAISNQFSGNLPNFAYGYGIANAYNLLKNTNNTFINSKDSIIQCGRPANIEIKGEKKISSIIWSDLSNSNLKTISNPGYYSFISYDTKKCISKDSIKININNSKPTIYLKSSNGTELNCKIKSSTLKVFGSNNYNWSNQSNTFNLDSLIITNPGKYIVSTFLNTQCEAKDSIIITIDTIKPTISIKSIGSNSISCLNEPVKLKITSGNTYQWNGGLYLDKDTNIIVIPGTYKVSVIGFNNCESIDSIKIDKDPNPLVMINNTVNSQYITCKQKTILLTPSGAINYSWNKGKTFSDYSNQIEDSGMVVLTGFDAKGCVGKDSLLFFVDTIKPILKLKFIGSNSISCNNDPVIIEASGALNYIWSSGDNTKNARNSFTSPGKYSLIGTNLNGCTAKDSIILTKTNYPPTPTIEFKDSTLTASQSINYQWYKNGIELEHDTLQSLKIKENGTYMVTVNLDGCISTSSYYKTNLRTETNYFNSIRIYPNPIISNQFEIKNLKKNSIIEIFDISGKVIDFKQIDINHFEINNIENGIYFIRILDGLQSFTFKILKN